MESRKGHKYDDGELEVILSLIPTLDNIKRLSSLLKRSEEAIEVVYKISYDHGPFGNNSDTQVRKIVKDKKNVGIVL